MPAAIRSLYLLHLCLSHVDVGRDAARAGATCKHWHAVAGTERLWREICLKRWPSIAKLRNAPANYLAYYKLKLGGKRDPPNIDLPQTTMLVDGVMVMGRLTFEGVQLAIFVFDTIPLRARIFSASSFSSGS